MKIEINKKDYDILLKQIAIWNWVYWIMSDAVSSKYKKEAIEWNELIHKILKNCDDDNIKDIYDWKNIFTEKYTDKIFNDIRLYEDYIIEDATWIDINEINKNLVENFDMDLFNEVVNEKMNNNPLFNKS